MNIFKRKKPIVVEMPIIPPRPDPIAAWRLLPTKRKYAIGRCQLAYGQHYCEILRDDEVIENYYYTFENAQKVVAELNAAAGGKYTYSAAELNKWKIERRNKEIADWDKKYGADKC